IHIMTDDDHQPALVVVDSPPLGCETVVLEHRTAVHILKPGHLKAVVQIIYDVEDGIFVIKIYNLAVRKDAFHAGDEVVPLDCAVEIVAHEESAAQQEIAEL